MNRRLPPIPVSPALAEGLARDGVLDDLLEGRGLRFTPARQLGQPTVPQPFYIPPFDTSSFVDPPEPEAKLEPENGDKPTYPAPPVKKRRWRP